MRGAYAASCSFSDTAGCESVTLWEWKRGEGYTLPITHDRKAQIAAVVAERSFLKIVRFLPFTDPRIQSGQMPEFSRETFRAILPIVTR